MNPKTLQSFKTRLEAERDAVLHSHDHHEQGLRSSKTSNDTAGPERASEITEAGIEARIVESEEMLLKKITLALERIEEGTYGTCENCEGEIPEARLEAKPSVSLCVPCQEAKDSA